MGVAAGARQEVVWGLGYRLIRDDMEGSISSAFVPASRTYDLLSAFAQDEIELVADRLRLTLGSKFEYGDFSGLEVQPNGRLLWTPAEGRTVWGAVSRAVRTPARSDHDIRSVFAVAPPGAGTLATFAELQGNPDFESEELIALEMGYRTRLTGGLFLDLAAFYNFYDQLLTVEQELPYADPSGSYLLAPAVIYNRMSGRTWGMELASECWLRDAWRLRAAYTLLEIRIDLDEDSGYTGGLGWDGVSPEHQLSLRSSLDLPGGIELDLWGRYVGDLPYISLDGYFDLDVRLGWKVGDRLEISLSGQDLLDGQRAEFRAPHSPTLSTEAQRGAYGALRLDF